MRFALLAASLLLTGLPAQTPGKQTPNEPPAADPAAEKPAAPTPAKPKPVDKLQQRLQKDLGKVAAQIAATPHAFRGTLKCESTEDLADYEWQFVGACNQQLAWFTLDDWRVVSSSYEHVAVSQDGAPWGKPQGDSPDVPLTPRMICKHMPKAQLSRPEPAEFRGRPAIRVRATWTGKAAKEVVRSAAVPTSSHEQLLDALASSAGRNRKNCVVDAVMRYDPASSKWLSLTLRCAFLDGREIPDDQQKPPAPDGLLPFSSHPLYEMQWHIERCEQAELPLPALDAKAKKLLAPKQPAKTAPAKGA